MTTYATAAVRAVRLCRNGVAPPDAWRRALIELGCAASVLQKVCPREAFLGLAARGDVIGVPPSGPDRPGKNRQYATSAVDWLREHHELNITPSALWRRVAGDTVHHNSQMNVVLELWKKGKLVGSPRPRRRQRRQAGRVSDRRIGSARGQGF